MTLEDLAGISFGALFPSSIFISPSASVSSKVKKARTGSGRIPWKRLGRGERIRFLTSFSRGQSRSSQDSIETIRLLARLIEKSIRRPPSLKGGAVRYGLLKKFEKSGLAGSKPLPSGEKGSELNSPGNMFLGLLLSLQMRPSKPSLGEWSFTAVRRKTSLRILIHHQNWEILMIAAYGNFPTT